MARRSTGSAMPRHRKAAPRTGRTAASARTKGGAPDGQDTAFVDALSVDFRRHGATAITRLREEDPVTYMKLCASVLPKAVIDGMDPLDSLTDEELHERARRLAEKVGLGPRPDAGGTGTKDE